VVSAVLGSYIIGVAVVALVLWDHFDFFERYTGTHDDAATFTSLAVIVGMIAPAIAAPAFLIVKLDPPRGMSDRSAQAAITQLTTSLPRPVQILVDGANSASGRLTPSPQLADKSSRFRRHDSVVCSRA
jgi:hypothetical protein